MKNWKSIGFFVMLFVCGQLVQAQGLAKDSSVLLDFSFQTSEGEIDLQTPFQFEPDGAEAQLNMLRFYVGNLALSNARDLTTERSEQWHLLDISEPRSLLFEFKVDTNIQGLSFQLGVDSLTNDAGVHGGALDPTKGMYWAWQTGYINMKLEGFSAQCPEAKGGFTYHFGGFLDGLDASRTIDLALAHDAQISLDVSNEVSVVFEVDRLLYAAHQSLGCKLMRPAKAAVEFMRSIDTYMRLEQ